MCILLYSDMCKCDTELLCDKTVPINDSNIGSE